MEPVNWHGNDVTNAFQTLDQHSTAVNYFGYVVTPLVVAAGVYAGYVVGKGLCQKLKSLLSRAIEPSPPLFQETLTQLKTGRISPSEFVATETFQRAAPSDYINAFAQVSRNPYQFGIDTFCRLFPVMLSEKLSAYSQQPISTAPVAQDAPINFIWVGSKLPDKYLETPIKMAAVNPEREVVLWYFSPCLSPEDAQAMKHLPSHKLYRQAIDSGCRILVLDLADIDLGSLPGSVAARPREILSDIYKDTTHYGFSSLLCADVTRHFLMASGSDAIDQVLASTGKQAALRSSTGMIYMDLDVPEGLKLSQWATNPNFFNQLNQPEFRMAEKPISQWLTQRLPAGFCMYCKRGLDHGFLAVNQRWHPFFLKMFHQECSTEKLKASQWQNATNINHLISEVTFGPLLKILCDTFHPVVTEDTHKFRYSSLNVYFAAFSGTHHDNDHTVEQVKNLKNTDTSASWSVHD